MDTLRGKKCRGGDMVIANSLGGELELTVVVTFG